MKKTNEERLSAIRELVSSQAINNQIELLEMLRGKGFELTQATLSRDLKKLKIIKSVDDRGNYIYTLSGKKPGSPIPSKEFLPGGALSLEFSGDFGIIKTPPGYAGVIALDIDNLKSEAILGTLAGDDTILLIPREGFSREEIAQALGRLNPSIKED